MEDFRGIAEESFPSFLTNSLLGNSGILENVTLSSNLGLPVAVSTLARNRPSTDNRYPDAQASYLIEERLLVPSESSPGCQSDTEPRERLQLSFRGDDSVSRKKNCIESPHLPHALMKPRAEEEQAIPIASFSSQHLLHGVSPLEQVPDSSLDFRLQAWMNNQEHKIVLPDTGKCFEDKTSNSDFNHTNLLENEQLLTLTSLEDSSDDDINDEEFYDDHLEAYFEQLAIPAMIYEDLEGGQDSAQNDFRLPTRNPSQGNENSVLNCGFQSEDSCSLTSHDVHSSGISETIHRESEDRHACLPGTTNYVGTKGTIRHVDDVVTFYTSAWRTEKEGAASLKDIVPDQSKENTGETTLMKTFSVANEKLSPVDIPDTNTTNGNLDPTDSIKEEVESPLHQNKHLASSAEVIVHRARCLDNETLTVPAQKPVSTASLTSTSDNKINSADIIWSPTCERRTCECFESVAKTEDQISVSQNVVYQNEEGKWVTDLAYYTSFTNEDLQLCLNNEVDEDFRSGLEVLDLIAKDEEEFNKEHQFIQEENIDAQNISAMLRDTSWVATINYNLLKKSLSPSDFNKDDASYLRLSLGEFFAERSEALGCLGGSNSVKRPSFGYFIRSPEKREPFPLIRKSDLSRSNLEKEMTHLNHDLFSGNGLNEGDVNGPSQAQLSEGSITLQPEELQSISQVDESEVTLTASKDLTEDTLFSNTNLQDHKDELSDGDSVLRISTIASAIADVSVSTDPAQFVAMMKTLKNKTRDNSFQGINKQKVTHVLLNDLEKSYGSSAFDMEKYLTKTEVSRYGGELGNFSQAGTSDIWDLSLPKEQTVEDMYVGNSHAPNIRQPKEIIPAIFYGESGKNMTQASLRTTNSSSVLTSARESDARESEDIVIDAKRHSTNNRLPDAQSPEKATSLSTPPCNSYSSVRIPRTASLRCLEECEVVQGNQEQLRPEAFVGEASSSDKHVAFEGRLITSPKNVDLKNTSLEYDGSGLEEDLENFRPSTSPLSHSSPSEISGTSSSRCAWESLDSTHHQNPFTETELSQLASSHADVSRLTYVSVQENTSPVITAEASPEDHRGDVTSDLSTTVVQASSAPSEEQTMDKLGEKVTETTFLSSRTEDGRCNIASSQDLSSRSRATLEASKDPLSDLSKQDLIGQAVLNKLGLSHWSGSATSQLPVLSQKAVDQGQKITFNDLLSASSESSGHIPNQRTSEGQHSSASHISAHSSAEVQTVPAVFPALWTGHSFHTASLVQQHLGTVTSGGNITLPQCHAGSTSVCGLPGCSYPTIAEHVALGICLGPNLTSRLMGPASLCNLCSDALHHNLLSGAKPFPVQPDGASCEPEPWDSGVMSRIGNARVPEELKFPHACCVGIASQTPLSVLNPTDRWLQVNIKVLSVSVNGEKMDLSTYPCLVFKNKVLVRPHATEEIKVLFIPSSPGIFRCMFSVTSWPFSADAETVVQAEALGSRVILTAIAETPVIEVETEKKGVLDFGDLTYEGWKALPLKLINRTHAAVPIRLIINANALAWHCFTFSKEPIHTSLRTVPYGDVIAQLAAPSVVSHVMPASSDGQDPECLIIWVLFHSPKKVMIPSEILDPAEEFLARVDIEVDSPNPIPVLRSVSLRARVGVARIHAPKDLQTVHLLTSINSSTKQHLPLKNAGNIEVYLDIKVAEQGSHFSVNPENLFLKPGEEHEVIVSFTPKNTKACEERILKIFVKPFGPQYEVVLKGEVISSGSKPLPHGPSCPDIPSILSNKQFLTWGGVPLGRTQLQKLALRSSSTSTTQHLRLLIKGQDQDCFQLQNTFGSEERLTSSCEIRIRPEEDYVISVLFAPTRLSCMLAKLEIKHLGNRSQPGIKFMIPLSGYGGTSNLILEDVKKLSDSYMVTVNDLVPGKENRVVFSVRNTGSRAAFVRAVGFKDSQKKVLVDPKVLRIFPDKFVLKERTQEDITLLYNPSDRTSSYKTATELSTIYFFGGDEISRQQYRRVLLHKPEIIKQILPEHSLLQNIDFAEVFQDELLVDEVYDLPQRPNDIQLFYGNMRKITLSVIGEFRDCVSSSVFLQPSSKANSESKSESRTAKNSGNVSLDVLPVKGPQGPPFLSQTAHPPQAILASEKMWTIWPEHLILVAPSSCDMAKTGRFQIINNSVRLLKFELYWPAHCLTVTPQHGFVAPESKLQILVSPNSSLSTKQSLFPWSGLIYIHCDNGQKKIVKVQIRENLTQDLVPHLFSGTSGILAPAPEPPITHLTKPIAKPPSTKVEIRSKTVTFPPTEPGKTSENCVEFENHGPTDVKWHLSSFAPPYVKGVDESGNVFRATYTAFRCSPVSGTLESHGIQKVSVMFLPRDRGDYAQFWDVECHPVKEPHMKHTLRFQLSGQSIRAENKPEDTYSSRDSLVKIDVAAMPRRFTMPEDSAPIPGQPDSSPHGVYAPRDVYMFMPTRVGESRTLKVNLRNNSYFTHLLKFFSPREPFYIKHSKYSLRARHYIHIPVHFRPVSTGRFEALLVIQTDEGKSIAVRLVGEALDKS